MNAASMDDTGVLTVPTSRTIDDDIRQDLTHAAWMMAVVTLPGIAVLATMLL